MTREEYLAYKKQTAEERVDRVQMVVKAYAVIEELERQASKFDSYYKKPTHKLRRKIKRMGPKWYYHHVERRYELIEKIKEKYLKDLQK